MADLVQVAVESSWEVLRGSLEKGVSVVFLDPATLDPLVPPSPPPSPSARKLVLARPQDSSVPCEITVKFQGRLCSVHSFYTLSTSRICELYSRASLQMDPDYVCTVRGWVPDTETAPTEEDAEGVNSPECSSKLLCQDHANKDACGECRSDIAAHFCFSEDTRILTGHVLENTEPLVSSVKDIGTVTSKSLAKAEEDDFQRSVYSSGDDSWVEVKFSKLVNGKLPDKSSTISQNIEGELDSNQEGADDCNDDKLKTTMLTVHNMEILQSKDDSNPTLDLLAHQNVSHHSEKDFQSSGCSGCGLGQCRMYEAELELVDHDPWAAVTIRCLSLQDKSCVEIDQMVFLAVQTPLVSSSNRPNQMAVSGGSSALLAMLIPSMLQMVHGVSDQRAREPCFGRSQTMDQDLMKFDKELQTPVQSEARSSTCDETLVQENKVNALADIPCVSPYNKIINTNLEVVDEDTETVAATVNAGGDANKGHRQNVPCGVPQNFAIETACHPQTAHATSHVDKLTNSKVSGEQTEQCHVDTSSSNRKAQPQFLEGKCDQKEDESFPKENFLTVLETFTDRFDRLEAICVRMESYLHRAVESLDGRLLALERECLKVSTEAPMASREVEVETGFSDSSITSESNPKDVDTPIQVQTDAQASPGKPVVYAEAYVDFKDIQINSRKESLVSELGEDLQIKEPITYEALVGGSSTLSEQPLREKPCVSLDDAWASALSAFSSLNAPSVIHSSHDKVTCRDFFESSESEECSISQPASFISTSAPPQELDGNTLDENDIFCTEDITVDATKPQAEVLTGSSWYSYYARSPSTKKATSLFCKYESSSEDETADSRDDKLTNCIDEGSLNNVAKSQHSLIDDSPESSYARDEWFRPTLPLNPEGSKPIDELCWSEPLSPAAHRDSCNIAKLPKSKDLIVDLLSFPESSLMGVEVSGDKAALKTQKWESHDMHTVNSKCVYGPDNQSSPKTDLGNLLVKEGRSAFRGVGTLCDSDMYFSQEFDLFQENLSTDNWSSLENPSSVRDPAGTSMEAMAGLEELFLTYAHGSQSGESSSSNCPLSVPDNRSHDVKQGKLETVPADARSDWSQSCMVFPGFEIFS